MGIQSESARLRSHLLVPYRRNSGSKRRFNVSIIPLLYYIISTHIRSSSVCFVLLCRVI